MSDESTVHADAKIETVLCLGEVRWVPLSSMQAHRRKLQQLFQIRTYHDSRPVAVREEWRDVPSAGIDD